MTINLYILLNKLFSLLLVKTCIFGKFFSCRIVTLHVGVLNQIKFSRINHPNFRKFFSCSDISVFRCGIGEAFVLVSHVTFQKRECLLRISSGKTNKNLKYAIFL